MTVQCHQPGSEAARRQHKQFCTSLYPKVTPYRYITHIPRSNIYHEHAVAGFCYWYQKIPLANLCGQFFFRGLENPLHTVAVGLAKQ